jgi:hypothetical protein
MRVDGENNGLSGLVIGGDGFWRPVLALVLIYLCANVFMLLNNTRYWDDWCFYSFEGMKAIETGVGSPFMIPIHVLIMKAGEMAPLVYHLIVGATEAVGLVLLYRILLMLSVPPGRSFVLTAFFMLMPFNQAKMNICCFSYSLGLVCCLTAVFLFLKDLLRSGLWFRILSWGMFFAGYMFLPSTIMLVLAFFLFLAARPVFEGHAGRLSFSLCRGVLIKLLSWADVLVIPFIYSALRFKFWLPVGSYSGLGYREVTPGLIAAAPVNFFKVFFYNFFGFWGELFKPLYSQTGIFAVIFIMIAAGLAVFFRRSRIEPVDRPGRMFLIGLYFFLAGAAAYVLVGLLPQFGSVYCRHQALLKFGMPVMLLAGIGLLSPERSRRGAVVLLSAMLLIVNISWQLQYQKSWIKQMALEQAFRREPLLAEHVNFVVVDNMQEYNEYGSNSAVYYYAGLMYKIHGTQTRYIVNHHDLPGNLLRWGPDQYIIYNMKDIRDVTKFTYHVYIDQGSAWLSNVESVKILYQYYFNKSRLEESLSRILRIRVLPYNEKIES